MPSLGAGELIIILLIVVVVFGATKLPQLGDGLGRAIKNFKRAVNTDDQNQIDVTPSSKKAGELRGDAGGGAGLEDAEKPVANKR
jgi:sec-independent protein translocase protein TatA